MAYALLKSYCRFYIWKRSFCGNHPGKQRDGKSDVPFNFSQDFDWLLVYTNGNENEAIIGRNVDRNYITTPDFPDRPWALCRFNQPENNFREA